MLIPGVSCTGFSKCTVAMLISGATFYICFSRRPFFFVCASNELCPQTVEKVSVFFCFFLIYLKVTDLLLKQAAVFVPL